MVGSRKSGVLARTLEDLSFTPDNPLSFGASELQAYFSVPGTHPRET
jgi:hypothetical protein